MKKEILTFNFWIMILLSSIGGAIDGFTFVERNGSFCLIQTGNIIKAVYAFVTNDIPTGVYTLIVIISFAISILIYFFIKKLLDKKLIDHRIITLILTMLLLIPSIVFRYDNNIPLKWSNIFSGICLSFIGGMIMISYSNIKFNNYVFTFNAAIMTGNLKNMMVNTCEYIDKKDKQKGFFALCYLSVIVSFVVLLATVMLLNQFVVADWNFYSLFIVIYCLIVITLILLFVKKYGFNNKTDNNKQASV